MNNEEQKAKEQILKDILDSNPPNYNKDFWMDDVGHIALLATDLVEAELKKCGIELITPQEDLFYVPIFEALEKFSNGNYRHEI